MTKDQATRRGRALLKKLGHGWRLKVHENMGWHFHAECMEGHLSCHENYYGKAYRPKYWCQLSDGDLPGAGSYLCLSTRVYTSPSEAVKAVVNMAEDTVFKLVMHVKTASLVARNL